MLSKELKRNLIFMVEAVDSLDTYDLTVQYTSWLFHDSGSQNTCIVCESKDGDVYKLEDPNDLLTLFPYGAWVADDTFACNIHPHCGCFCTLITESSKDE